MRKPFRALSGTAAAVAVLLTATGASAAAGAPGAGPAPVVKEIAQGRQDGPVEVDVKGATQVNFREITLPPGAGTGRHCHYGQLVGVVKSGTLTHYAPVYTGGVHVYHAGDSLVEGSGYVHEGRNEGTEDTVLWVTYVTPQGKPLAESDLAHCGTGH
ncbi:cupin domain-containing protein [Streptomyces sp. NPDC051555]|uniref:cupin domain-containing protein n=1 Tax=Streptomyces sp. NPDC051555 TaxID=3365657 RepID=UPI00379AEE67